MLVYVMRHGQSVANIEGLHVGQYDSPLTEQGYEDARKAGRKLAGIHFDWVVSSDLIRAVETCRTALPGCEPELFKELREVDVGSLSGKVVRECWNTMGPKYADNRRNFDFTDYGGENGDMIMARVSSFMKLLEERKDCENVAVFCHEGAIYCIMRYVLGQPIKRMQIDADNGSITKVEWKDGKWMLRGFNL